jgi:hypothetical protein
MRAFLFSPPAPALCGGMSEEQVLLAQHKNLVREEAILTAM